MKSIVRRAGLALAAAMIGGVGLAVVAEPAGATTMVAAPTVTITDGCIKGVRLISVKNNANVPIKVRDAGGSFTLTVNAGPSPVAAPSYDKAAGFQLQWSTDNTNWNDSSTASVWVAAAKCLPKVVVVNPTCDNPKLSVAIENPVTAPGPVQVTFNGSGAGGVVAGDFAAYADATQNVAYTWNAPLTGVSRNETVTYVKPTGCEQGKPGAGVIVPGPGKPHHGHGAYQPSTTPVANNGGGTTAPAAPAATEGEQLAVTGSRSGTTATVGLALFIGGALLAGAGVLYMRRRRVRFTAR